MPESPRYGKEVRDLKTDLNGGRAAGHSGFLSRISHFKRNCSNYNIVMKASNEAISGFLLKKSVEFNG